MCVQNQTVVAELVVLGFGNLHLLKEIIFFICFLTYIAILAGNLLIIGLIVTSPRLHSPMYFFLCNLSLCEVIFTTNIMPYMLHLVWSGGGLMSLKSCITQFYIHISSGSTECLLLTVMAFDRYMAICNPLRYSSFMTFKTQGHLVLSAWLSGFMGMFVFIITISNLGFCGPNIVDHLFCDLAPLMQISSTDTYLVEMETLVYAFAMGLLPFAIIILSYVAIFITINRIPSETGRRKAFSTCSSHLVSVCTFFGTIFIIYLVPSQQNSNEMNKILSLFYTVLTPLFNPIIYSLRNQEMKACLATKTTNQRNHSTITEFFLVGFQDLHSFKVPFFILLLIIYTLTICGNVLIIFLVSSSHLLQSPMYFFLCHLSLCDILFTTNIVPNMLQVILKGGSAISFPGCFTQFYMFCSCGSAECCLLAIMSYDRYLAICNPLRYLSIMNFTCCLQLVVWSWSLGFLFIVITLIMLLQLEFCDLNIIDHFYCDLSPILKLSCSDTFPVEMETFFLTNVVVLLPFVFVIVTYVYIFFTIFGILSDTGRQKAFSTCSSHLAVVCSYYGSLISIYLTPSGGHNLNLNKALSLLYTVMTPLLNPVIYSLRNKEIRKTFIIFFGGRKNS